MNILRKILNILPPSSRSFHQMYTEIVDFRADNWASLDAIEEHTAKSTEEVSAIKRDVEDLSQKLDAHSVLVETILWDLYKKDDETLEQAKQRFFDNFPKATGNLREVQLELLDVLKSFDAICKENNVPYFLDAGTLLGAVRHKGFIPWDDDIDVGVMHDDIDKLKEIVTDNDQYTITDLWDQNVPCRQVRFKKIDVHDDAPFIDLFIFEYSNCKQKEDLIKCDELRHDLMEEFKKLYSEGLLAFPDGGYLEKTDDNAGNTKIIYSNYLNRAYEEGLYAAKDKASSIVWSLENNSMGTSLHVIPLETLNNMETLEFEGEQFPALGCSKEMLNTYYKDWLSLPKDIKTHFKHVAI